MDLCFQTWIKLEVNAMVDNVLPVQVCELMEAPPQVVLALAHCILPVYIYRVINSAKLESLICVPSIVELRNRVRAYEVSDDLHMTVHSS